MHSKVRLNFINDPGENPEMMLLLVRITSRQEELVMDTGGSSLGSTFRIRRDCCSTAARRSTQASKLGAAGCSPAGNDCTGDHRFAAGGLQGL